MSEKIKYLLYVIGSLISIFPFTAFGIYCQAENNVDKRIEFAANHFLIALVCVALAAAIVTYAQIKSSTDEAPVN